MLSNPDLKAPSFTSVPSIKEIDCHFARDTIKDGLITLSATEQLADLLSKAFGVLVSRTCLASWAS